MSNALIISDTHGLTEEVVRVSNSFPSDITFHCGDFCVEKSLVPFSNMTLVKGNCDFDPSVPDEQIVEWEGIRFFITHGHLYNVNQSLLNLTYRAKELKADVALFGHTHYPLCTENDGLILVNPGSLKEPRGYSVPSFVRLYVETTEQGKKLTFKYNDVDGKEISTLCKSFYI